MSLIHQVCRQGVEENKEHYLLDCPTFLPERAEFASALIVGHASGVWPRTGRNPYSIKIKASIAYILGQTEPH
jgi:hypothetical protein